jgi:serine/threonine protein kinase
MVQINENTQKHILLGQGTYGCVYRPGIQCTTGKPTSKKFVSKLQVEDTESQDEVAFGKRITDNIRNYSFFFAPIIESCDVNISKIDERQLNQCEVYEKKKDKPFLSNKMEYVGGNTLGEFFDNIISNIRSPEKMKDFLMKLVDTHMYLMSSVELLNRQNIIHLDIKENNIMYHEKNHVFVLIDFGLSVDSESIELSNYKKDVTKRPFGIYVDSYVPWNVDVLLLSYIARQVQPRRDDGKYNNMDPSLFDGKIQSTVEMKDIVTRFIKTNKIFKNDSFKEKELDAFKQKYHTLIQSWKDGTWGNAWTELQRHHRTWDAYAVNVTILRLLMDVNVTDFLKENTKQKPVEKPVQNQLGDTIRMAFTGNQQNKLETVHFFKQYIEWLKSSILSTPSERPLPLDCIPKIKSFFNKVPKPMMNQWTKYTEGNVLTEKNQKQIGKQLKETTLENMEAENKMRMQNAKFNIVAPPAPAAAAAQ